MLFKSNVGWAPPTIGLYRRAMPALPNLPQVAQAFQPVPHRQDACATKKILTQNPKQKTENRP